MRADDSELVILIRESLPAVGEPSPPIDLWPRLERRLGARRARPGGLDWVLAGLAVALLAGFPETVLVLLYHL